MTFRILSVFLNYERIHENTLEIHVKYVHGVNPWGQIPYVVLICTYLYLFVLISKAS